MSDDLLRQAARALRESTESTNESAPFTRARVMSSLHQARRQRTTRRALLWPLAAVLIGSSAWAAASGRLPEAVQAILRASGFGVTVPKAAFSAAEPHRAVGARPAAPHAEATAMASSQSAPWEREPETGVEPQPLPVAQPEHKLAAKAPPSSAPAASSGRMGASPTEQEQALYREAHRAHFEERNWASALSGWDAYLEGAPRGRFAQEALYNRALCLVRLGRTSEARSALAPFAEGKFGDYRKREALALLEALGKE